MLKPNVRGPEVRIKESFKFRVREMAKQKGGEGVVGICSELW